MTRSVALGLTALLVAGLSATWLVADDAPEAAAAKAAAAPIAKQATGRRSDFFDASAVSHGALPEPKSARIARLGATGNPRDAFQAYQLANACASIRESRRTTLPEITPDQVDAQCGDITNDQIRNMEKHLDLAVKAAVPGALVAKSTRGPFGDGLDVLTTRPNDPMVVQWRGDMVDALTAHAAETGELLTLFGLENAHASDLFGRRDMTLSLTYFLVQIEIMRRNPKARTLIEAMERNANIVYADLSTEQKEAARQNARAILARCCARK